MQHRTGTIITLQSPFFNSFNNLFNFAIIEGPAIIKKESFLSCKISTKEPYEIFTIEGFREGSNSRLFDPKLDALK